MKSKKMNITFHKTNTRVTIPVEAIRDLGITKRMFFEWEETKTELVGTLCKSPNPPLTSAIVAMGAKGQLTAEILGFYVKKHKIKATKYGGPKIRWEWNKTTMCGRIPIRVK